MIAVALECESAALLRTPKVYNALITTDQNLTPSRAYPVIQPTIHDPSFYYSPYGGFPYYYDPYGFNPFEPTFLPRIEDGVGAGAGGESTTIAANGADANASAITEKSPIPLNEFGFPPSLIPISPSKNPINLSPFPYRYNHRPNYICHLVS